MSIHVDTWFGIRPRFRLVARDMRLSTWRDEALHEEGVCLFFISAKDEPCGYETNTEKETLLKHDDDRTPSWCCLHNKKHDVYVFFTLFASPFCRINKKDSSSGGSGGVVVSTFFSSPVLA